MKLVIVAAVFASLSALASPIAMEREGGAGALIAAEFTTAAREAIRLISVGDKSFNATEVFGKVADIEVKAVQDICFTNPNTGEANCVDAYYDGQQTIKFSTEGWDKMSCTSKLVVSSHELLRAAGIERGDYEYSGRILANTVVRCEYTTVEEKRECAERVLLIKDKKVQLCDWLNKFSRDRAH